MSDLASEISALFQAGASADREHARDAFLRLRAALSSGTVRAAEPDGLAASGWRVNAWVKQGILLGFRVGTIVDMSADHGRWPFVDKDTMPLKRFDAASACGLCRAVQRFATAPIWGTASSACRRCM